MNCPTLMVLAELGRSNASLLAVAHDIAKRTHASIIGVARARPIEAMIAPVGISAGDVVREDIDRIEREAMAAEAEFRNRMKTRSQRLEWDMALTPHSLSREIADLACAADILMVGLAQDRDDLSNSSRRPDAGDLIMRAGRPVLVVPPGIERFTFGGALVAWKDCREARLALAAALPLLRLMNRVVVAEITDEASPEDAEARLRRITGWLARQGIEAVPHIASPLGQDGDRLLELAEEKGAELIVAGAYGHSRASEWVLGGMTRTLLHRCNRCTLLSH